jgi:Tfp pilus assembly major pilin PilA
MGSNRCVRHQRGISMIGFLFVAAVVLIAALLAFRMIPAYIEYYTVQKALESAITETNDPNITTIRRAVDRKLGADYVDSVSAKDVELSKVGNTITAYVNWEKKLPLVHNVSLLMEFNASASR